MQKLNDYDNKRKKTLRWGYLFAVVALCVFVLFIGRIICCRTLMFKRLRTITLIKNYRTATLKAARGNLFASDGSILATTVMRYDIYLDFKTMRDTIYTNNIGALTDSLSKMFGKPRAEYRKRFDEQRRKKKSILCFGKRIGF